MISVDPRRVADLQENLAEVQARVDKAANGRPVTLVAVSKYMPPSDLQLLYSSPHRQLHFGENYLQELLHKSSLLPADIHWHFQGALQTNKCKNLASQIRNLWSVETVDTVKKADALEKGRRSVLEGKGEVGEEGKKWARLRVYVQVNTSGEESKSGVEPPEAHALCRHIHNSCPSLTLSGLMTIGSRSNSLSSSEENPDFKTLVSVRDQISKELGVELGLSMGMSSDFEEAIRMGSTNVRVGSLLFGKRKTKEEMDELKKRTAETEKAR
ncbi:hypothetical protein SAICODRAFT_52572 [Saitoella complicata NRRL Y-17804]|nr:uncharacterized protein SAICODRAFT_52572 [Saitoella complicata NRRL Y-17804]ODQ55745.1 hypothetical protein SAICODRAFT_52572 [Saitoella complicata NRRL Y-17804]